MFGSCLFIKSQQNVSDIIKRSTRKFSNQSIVFKTRKYLVTGNETHFLRSRTALDQLNCKFLPTSEVQIIVKISPKELH